MDIWVETFKIFANMGVVGVIAYFFLRNAQKDREVMAKNYQKLLDSVTVDLRKDIKDNSDVIEKNMNFYNLTIDSILDEVVFIKNSNIQYSNMITNSIIDDKVLSHNLFKTISELYINWGVERVKVEIADFLDQNGFKTKESLELLKDNILRTAEKNRNYARLKIMDLEIDEYVKNKYHKKSCSLWDKNLLYLEDYIKTITLVSLESDKNYRQTKQHIFNIIDEYKDDLIQVVKNSTKLTEEKEENVDKL